MDCQTSDSKRLLKVFDASKCRKTRRKRDDDTTADTDGSASVPLGRTASAETSIVNVLKHHELAGPSNRDRQSSSPERASSPVTVRRRRSRSPRMHRRPMNRRDGISLALKAGLASSPRSVSPHREADAEESVSQDQDSFIYTLLTEAIEKDKKKQRQSRRQEEHKFEREPSEARFLRHHRRRRTEPAQDMKRKEEKSPTPLSDMNQAMLLETFANLCSQMKERARQPVADVPRTLSHKSLQCEVEPNREHRESYLAPRPDRQPSREHSRESHLPPRVRSQGHISVAGQSRVALNYNEEKCSRCYVKEKLYSKMDVRRPCDRYHEYSDITPTRSRIDARELACCRDRCDYRDCERRERTPRDRSYSDKRRVFEEKTSRSFDVHREPYIEEDRRLTVRSDRDRRYDERDKRYYDRELRNKDFDNERSYGFSKDRRRSKRNSDGNSDRASIVSRDEDYYRERERERERERDCAMSVADDASSVTVSGKSMYLRSVKQEILEQREAMDKMMKLWRELMRCFKSVSQKQGPSENKDMQETAANARDSAAAQLRLWQECMRRYETVARDVGDTDARLMEEINKQRSEMSEMAGMWQECLQRYREMSTDFNTLKQKVESKPVVPPECASRMMPSPLICAEGEGNPSVASYRLPPNYQPPPQMAMAGGHGSPLRPRASAPPAWWWGGERQCSPRRRSSPESRGSRDRDRRHRHRDRDDSRYKEKSSKPSMARSEHRHRKR